MPPQPQYKNNNKNLNFKTNNTLILKVLFNNAFIKKVYSFKQLYISKLKTNATQVHIESRNFQKKKLFKFNFII